MELPGEVLRRVLEGLDGRDVDAFRTSSRNACEGASADDVWRAAFRSTLCVSWPPSSSSSSGDLDCLLGGLDAPIAPVDAADVPVELSTTHEDLLPPKYPAFTGPVSTPCSRLGRVPTWRAAVYRWRSLAARVDGPAAVRAAPSSQRRRSRRDGNGFFDAPTWVRVATAWARIEKYLSAHAERGEDAAAGILDSLNPPASRDALASVAARSLRYCYAIHDGQHLPFDEALRRRDVEAMRRAQTSIYYGLFGGVSAYEYVVCSRMVPVADGAAVTRAGAFDTHHRNIAGGNDEGNVAASRDADAGETEASDDDEDFDDAGGAAAAAAAAAEDDAASEEDDEHDAAAAGSAASSSNGGRRPRTGAGLAGRRRGSSCGRFFAANFRGDRRFAVSDRDDAVSVAANYRGDGDFEPAAPRRSSFADWFCEYARRLHAGVYKVGPVVPDDAESRAIVLFNDAVDGLECAEATTRGVRVRASAAYVPGHPSCFAYSIRLGLAGDLPAPTGSSSSAAEADDPSGAAARAEPCQLFTRAWTITDLALVEEEGGSRGGFGRPASSFALGRGGAERGVRRVRGQGVVGKFPRLQPGGWRDDFQVEDIASQGFARAVRRGVDRQGVFVYQSFSGPMTDLHRGSTFEGVLDFYPGEVLEPTGPLFEVRVPRFALRRPDFVY